MKVTSAVFFIGVMLAGAMAWPTDGVHGSDVELIRKRVDNPFKDLTGPAETNTALCKVKSLGGRGRRRSTDTSGDSPEGNSHGGLSFTLRVGRPFLNGVGCNPILDTLKADLGQVGGYQCAKAPGGNTDLYFELPGATGSTSSDFTVISSLQKAFPDVPFKTGRICYIPREMALNPGKVMT